MNTQISKTDLEEVIKVNEKAVILQTQNAEYFQEIIDNLENIETKYKELIQSNSQLESVIDKSIEELKELTKKTVLSAEAMEEFSDQFNKNIQTVQNVEKEIIHHFSDEEKKIDGINDNLKNIIDKIQVVSNFANELKIKIEFESKDIDSLKSILTKLKEFSEKSSQDIDTKINDLKTQKYKMVWLMGSGIFAAGLPVVIELVKFIITLFHH
jgi:predicted  nucleic acid-binding Zn-ribbon protein